MSFIGIFTDKNSENNIKNSVENQIAKNNLVFLNEKNIENYKNVRFNSIIINEKIKKNYVLEKILKETKYIVCNTDIHYKEENNSNIIKYGYNSKANITLSSATDESYLLYIQNKIKLKNEIEGMQEIKFEKSQKNINVYDGMIITLINLMYNGNE